MTLQEFNRLLETTGYPVAFREFPVPQEPPFLIYVTPETDNFSADGKVYSRSQIVQVELYTKEKDESATEKVRTALADFYYTEEEGYIKSERVYMVAFRITL